MGDNTYKYYIFYIKPKYAEILGQYALSTSIPLLYAYTTKKSDAKGFLKIHKNSAFIMKKMMLDREEVSDLAKNMQNNIIRPYKINTRTNDYSEKEIEVYMTEKEYMTVENICYSQIESIWKYVWEKYNTFILDEDYRLALIDLKFHHFQGKLDRGECDVTNWLEADLINTFITVYSPILEVSV